MPLGSSVALTRGNDDAMGLLMRMEIDGANESGARVVVSGGKRRNARWVHPRSERIGHGGQFPLDANREERGWAVAQT